MAELLAPADLHKPADDRTVASAHRHLSGECPWYRNVSEEKNCAHDPREHCDLEAAGGGALVKFTPRTAEASTVDKPTRPPGGPGLFHIKGRHLPPYMQHLWFHLVKEYGEEKAYRVAVGIVKKWKEGIAPGGKPGGKPRRVHADVQAAAAKNVAEWEKDKADAHARSRGKARGGHALAATGPYLDRVLALAQNTAPGLATRGDQYGLHQHPSQTTSPSPPLPPEVPVPTPAEVRKLAGQVPECSQADLSNTVRQFLETAAVKLEKNSELDALAMLRAAATAVISAHKADLGKVLPQVLQARLGARVPPAEQSSATSAMRQGTDRAQEWRTLEIAVQALATRIRKRYFHGVYNGPGQMARMTGESSMSALGKVLALAGHQQVATGADVSFPTESDTALRTPLLQPAATDLGIDGDAAKELSGLGALDKVRINSYLDAARRGVAENPGGAAQFLARAKVIAGEAGAHDLARHMHLLIEGLAYGRNATASGAHAEGQPGNAVNADSPSGANVRLAARLR